MPPQVTMGAMIRRFLGLLAAAVVLAAPATLLAQQRSVPGEPSKASKAAHPVAQLRLAPARTPAARVALEPAAEQVLQQVRERNAAPAARRGGRPHVRRVAIGVVRPVDGTARAPAAAEWSWSRVPGGHAAHLAVTSPQAESMRLALDLAGVPGDVELVFFGSADAKRLEGPVRVDELRDRTAPWWTPVTEGETQTVEVFVPAHHEPRALPLRVSAASHLVGTPSGGFLKRLQDIGKAGSCNVDVPCSPLNGNGAFQNVAESVAQMVYNDAGFTSLCTGTLLADGDPASQVPWFYGANHCFENENPPFKTPGEMQQVASTLSTLWGFEASACVNGDGNDTPRPSWSQLSGGATFVYNNVDNDVLFLRLNGTPPSHAFFSGWDANPISPGSGVITIHHPSGDLKKASEGSVQRLRPPGFGNVSASQIEVLWSRGTTEGGSSGAGLWTLGQATPAGAQYLFRGGLYGGTALCTNPTGTDYYSRFDVVFPALAQYLNTTGGPAFDVTDLWWNPAEDGWGLNLVQHPSRQVFGVWYTYAADGKRTWFVMPGGEWTSSTTFTGALYSVAGPPPTTFFDPTRVRRTQVGTATLTFTDANNGTFSYSVNGTFGTKSISRFLF